MKKFITIALAVAVLFSFAACQNETPTGYINSIGVTQSEVYVYSGSAYEMPDADGFTYVGYTNLGTTVSIPASDITLAPVDTSSPTFEFTYKNGTAKGRAVVEYEEITELVVDSSALSVYYAAPADVSGKTSVNSVTKKLDLDDLVVTAVYEGGDKELEIKDSNIVYAAEADQRWTKGEKKASVKFGNVSSDQFTYTVEENLVESVSLNQTEKYTTTYYESTQPAKSASLAYAAFTGTGDDATVSQQGIYVLLTYQGGEEYVAANNDSSYTINGVEVTGTIDTGTLNQLASVDNAAVISAEYNGTDCIYGITRTTGTVTIGIEEKVIDPSTVKVASTVTSISKQDYSSIAPSITFTAKYNDGSNYSVSVSYRPTNTTAANYYTMSPADLRGNNYVVGNRYPFTFTGVIDGETFTTTATLLLTAAPSSGGGSGAGGGAGTTGDAQ